MKGLIIKYRNTILFILLFLIIILLIVGSHYIYYTKTHSVSDVNFYHVQSLTINYNDKLPLASSYFLDDVKEDIVLKYIYNGKTVITPSAVGTYTVLLTVNNKEYRTTLTINEEKMGFNVKPLTILKDKTYAINDFVIECTDDCNYRYSTEEMANYQDVGTYQITIIATNSSGQEKSASTTLTIAENETTTENESTTENEEVNNLIKEAFTAINALRSDQGESLLSNDTTLNEAAMKRAEEVAVNFSHIRPDGRDWSTIYNDYNISYVLGGENYARGFNSGNDVINAFKSSQEQYESMLRTDFSKVGIGVYKVTGVYYWVVLFA